MLLNICRRFVFSFFVNFFTLFLFSLLRVFASFRFQTFKLSLGNGMSKILNFFVSFGSFLTKNLSDLTVDDDVNLPRKFESGLADLLELVERRPELAGNDVLVTPGLAFSLGGSQSFKAVAFLVQVAVLVVDEADATRVPLVRI